METGCQFHQRSMYSIWHIDPESVKNSVKSSVSFYAFGIYECKSCTQNVDENESGFYIYLNQSLYQCISDTSIYFKIYTCRQFHQLYKHLFFIRMSFRQFFFQLHECYVCMEKAVEMAFVQKMFANKIDEMDSCKNLKEFLL